MSTGTKVYKNRQLVEYMYIVVYNNRYCLNSEANKLIKKKKKWLMMVIVFPGNGLKLRLYYVVLCGWLNTHIIIDNNEKTNECFSAKHEW